MLPIAEAEAPAETINAIKVVRDMFLSLCGVK
jgi:hypothetical protein